MFINSKDNAFIRPLEVCQWLRRARGDNRLWLWLWAWHQWHWSNPIDGAQLCFTIQIKLLLIMANNFLFCFLSLAWWSQPQYDCKNPSIPFKLLTSIYIQHACIAYIWHNNRQYMKNNKSNMPNWNRQLAIHYSIPWQWYILIRLVVSNWNNVFNDYYYFSLYSSK